MNPEARKKGGFRSLEGNSVGPLASIKNELPQEYFLKMTVEFGAFFSEERNLPREEFIERLRSTAEQWKAGFVGEMMSHFADHLEAVAAYAPPTEREAFMHKSVPTIFQNYYEPCGSCKLPDEKPGSNCCTVIDPAIPTVVCFCHDVCDD
jgi:hypothetical protein